MTESITGLRLAAVGALAGAAAGSLFGLCSLLIQSAITRSLIAHYGDSAVDHGAAFLYPGSVIAMVFLGAIVGTLYVTARRRVPLLGRAGGILFAALLALVLQPVLALGLNYFSAVVSLPVTGAVPNGFINKCCAPQDVAPTFVLGLLMSGLLLLEGLGIHRLVQIGMRHLPRLPAVAYVVIAAGLCLPGLALVGLLFLFAIGMAGSE